MKITILDLNKYKELFKDGDSFRQFIQLIRDETRDGHMVIISNNDWAIATIQTTDKN